MAHEYTQLPCSRATQVPVGFDRAALRSRTGEPLEAQYLAAFRDVAASLPKAAMAPAR